jgi:hypothetical protein
MRLAGLGGLHQQKYARFNFGSICIVAAHDPLSVAQSRSTSADTCLRPLKIQLNLAQEVRFWDLPVTLEWFVGLRLS